MARSGIQTQGESEECMKTGRRNRIQKRGEDAEIEHVSEQVYDLGFEHVIEHAEAYVLGFGPAGSVRSAGGDGWLREGMKNGPGDLAAGPATERGKLTFPLPPATHNHSFP